MIQLKNNIKKENNERRKKQLFNKFQPPNRKDFLREAKRKPKTLNFRSAFRFIKKPRFQYVDRNNINNSSTSPIYEFC